MGEAQMIEQREAGLAIDGQAGIRLVEPDRRAGLGTGDTVGRAGIVAMDGQMPLQIAVGAAADPGRQAAAKRCASAIWPGSMRRVSSSRAVAASLWPAAAARLSHR
jgi:hypothetical protein